MKAVGIKALKNELSRYLQAVRQGELVLVLDREEVVAEIRRPSMPGRASGVKWQAFIESLEAEGLMRPGKAAATSMRDAASAGTFSPVANAAALIKEVRRDRG